MLRTLDAAHDRFGLKAPFRISRGVKTVADVVTVTIREGDATGRGEGVPYPRYGETVEGALAAIEASRALIEAGADRAELARAMPPGAARNAVDCALWDLEARLAGTSVAALAGRPEPVALASAITIGIDAPDLMAAAAARAARAPLLKVKVDAEHAADQIRAVRAAAPGPRLIVDPNESWTAAHLNELEDLLVENRIGLLEQPLPAGEAEFVDLDGPLWLAGDRPGGVVDHDGVLSPPAPGFWGAA